MSSNSPAFYNSAENGNNLNTEITFMNDTEVINQLNGFNAESITNDENGTYITDVAGNLVYVNGDDLGEISDSDDLVLSDEVNDIDITNEVINIPENKRMKHNVDEMTFEELKEYSKRLLANKKRYIKKYQQTAKGKAKIKAASAKYYAKNREKILQKKKEYYLKKKQMKNSA